MDGQQDPLVERVEKYLAGGEVSATRLVAELLNALADELPEHFGPNAQWAYRGFLRRRAEEVGAEAPYRRAFIAQSWQWE